MSNIQKLKTLVPPTKMQAPAPVPPTGKILATPLLWVHWFISHCLLFPFVVVVVVTGELSNEQMKNIVSMKPKNVNSRKSSKASMFNSTRQALDDFYRPYNKRLAKLLDDPKYAYWN